MQRYIDAHCHIGRATTDDGVAGFFCNSANPQDWADILATANADARVYACIGVHPWYATTAAAGWDARLREMLMVHPRAMVGEIGLDKTRPNMDIQRQVCIQQLNIAHDMGRVVHIHCVQAWGDMLDILRGTKLPPAIVFHGFGGSPEVMRQILQLGADVYFSYSPAVADTRFKTMRLAVDATPLNKILIESDAAMSTSQTALITAASALSDIKHIDINTMTDTIYQNADRIIKQWID